MRRFSVSRPVQNICLAVLALLVAGAFVYAFMTQSDMGIMSGLPGIL